MAEQTVKIRFSGDVSSLDQNLGTVERHFTSLGGEIERTRSRLYTVNGALRSSTEVTVRATGAADAYINAQRRLHNQLAQNNAALSTYAHSQLSAAEVQRKASIEAERAAKREEAARAAANKGLGLSATHILGYSAAYMAASTVLIGFINILKSIPEAGIKFEKAEASITATFKSVQLVGEQLKFLANLGDEAGVSVEMLRQSYGKFAASATKAGFSIEETNKQFANYVKTARALSLSQEEIDGALRAVTQIMSKGKITAEELQGQLGEHIPAAVEIMAKSMGVGTAELRKQMEQGKVTTEVLQKFSEVLLNEYSSGYQKAMGSLSAETARFGNSWNRLSLTIYEAVDDTLASIVRLSSEGLDGLNNALTTTEGRITDVTGALIAFKKESYFEANFSSWDRFSDWATRSSLGEDFYKNLFNPAKAKQQLEDFFGEFESYVPLKDVQADTEQAAKYIEKSLEVLKSASEEAKLKTRDALSASLSYYTEQANVALKAISDQEARIANMRSSGLNVESEVANLREREEAYSLLSTTLGKLSGTYNTLNTALDEKAKKDKDAIETEGKKSREQNELYGAEKKSEEAAKKRSAAVQVEIDIDKQHAEALKSTVESLTRQRIELEHGASAAKFYDARLRGLTEAEAGLFAAADQYNSMLDERKKLQREAEEVSGGLLTKYRNSLKDKGLVSDALDFSEVSSKTNAIISASEQYEASLKSIEEQADLTSKALKGMTSSGDLKPLSSQAAGTASQVVSILQKLGESYKNAVAIAANLKQESEFRPNAVGDGGKAYGVAQWHGDRQAEFSRVFGKDIRTSSLEEQLKFVVYELRKGNEISAGKKLDAAPDIRTGAAAVSRYYERPADRDAEMRRRADIASQIEKSVKGTALSQKEIESSVAAVNTESKTTLDYTAQYAGQIDSAKVSANDLGNLELQYMNVQMLGLVDSADKLLLSSTLTGEALRRAELHELEFNSAMENSIVTAEQKANFALEVQKLNEMSWRKTSGLASSYRAELEKSNLSLEQMNFLVSRRLQVSFENLMHEAEMHRKELTLSSYELKKMKALQEGYSKAQAESIAQAELLNENLEAINGIGESLTESLLSAVTEGKDAFGSFKDWLKEQFNSLILKPIISAVTAPISGMIGGVMQTFSSGISGGFPGAAAYSDLGGAGGLGGIGQLAGMGGGLSNLTSLFTGNQIGSAFGSAGNMFGTSMFSNAAGYSNWMYGGAGLLGGLFGQAAFGGQGGIGGGLGATLGMAVGGPIGALAGGLLGGLVGGLFGGERETTDQGIALNYSGGNFSGSQYSSWSEDGGWFGGDESGTDYTPLASELQKKINDYFDQTEKALLEQAEYFGYTDAQAVLDAFSTGQAQFSSSGDLEQQVSDWANGVRDRLYSSVFGNDFDELKNEGETLGDTLTRITTEIKTVVPVLEKLGFSYEMTKLAAAKMSDTIVEAAGGLEAFASAAGVYYESFFTEQEKLNKTFASGQRELTSFNEEWKTQINTKDDLRKYVEGLDLTTEAGQKAFAAAMKLAPALSSMAEAQQAFYDALQSVRDAMNSLVFSDLSILKPKDKKNLNEKTLDDLWSKAKTGDVAAIQEYSSKSLEYLAQMRDMYSSSDTYSSAYAVIMANLEELNKLYKDPKDGLELKGSEDSLGKITLETTEIASDLAALKGTATSQVEELTGIRAILAKLFSGQTDLASAESIAQAQRTQSIELTGELNDSILSLARQLALSGKLAQYAT